MMCILLTSHQQINFCFICVQSFRDTRSQLLLNYLCIIIISFIKRHTILIILNLKKKFQVVYSCKNQTSDLLQKVCEAHGITTSRITLK